jgi:hypothetical protein
MEHLGMSVSHAAAAALAAYRAARRANASKTVADDVALARFRAFFPMANGDECRDRMQEHLADASLLGRSVARTACALELAVSN